MEKKYIITLEASVCILDTARVMEWANQGWYAYKNDARHSLMLILRNEEEVTTSCIEQYVEAANNIGGDIRIAAYEEVKNN